MKVRDVKSSLRINKGPAVHEATVRVIQRLVPPMTPRTEEAFSCTISAKVPLFLSHPINTFFIQQVILSLASCEILILGLYDDFY